MGIVVTASRNFLTVTASLLLIIPLTTDSAGVLKNIDLNSAHCIALSFSRTSNRRLVSVLRVQLVCATTYKTTFFNKNIQISGILRLELGLGIVLGLVSERHLSIHAMALSLIRNFTTRSRQGNPVRKVSQNFYLTENSPNSPTPAMPRTMLA